jgi:microcystin-dependent protein
MFMKVLGRQTYIINLSLALITGFVLAKLLWGQSGVPSKANGGPTQRGLVRQVELQWLYNPPVGSVVAYVDRVDLDDAKLDAKLNRIGWMRCDGRTVLAADYPELAALFKDTPKKISLPNLCGRTVIGTGKGRGLTNRDLYSEGGEETHILTIQEMPKHSHGVTDPGHNHVFKHGHSFLETKDNGFPTPRFDAGFQKEPKTESAKTGISIDSSGGGQAHNIMQPFLALHYIIKVSSRPKAD